MNGAGGILYAIILEHKGKLYVWYRDFEGHLKVLEDRELEPNIRAVLSEPSGITELLDMQIMDWMAAHNVEEIGGFTKPAALLSVSNEKRVEHLEHSVYALESCLKHVTKERDMLLASQETRTASGEGNAAIIAVHLMNKVFPIESIVACAVVHGGCEHIAEACDELAGTIGENPKHYIAELLIEH